MQKTASLYLYSTSILYYCLTKVLKRPGKVLKQSKLFILFIRIKKTKLRASKMTLSIHIILKQNLYFFFFFTMNPNHYCEICFDGFEFMKELKSHRRKHIATCKVGGQVVNRNDQNKFPCPFDGCQISSEWSSGTFWLTRHSKPF